MTLQVVLPRILQSDLASINKEAERFCYTTLSAFMSVCLYARVPVLHERVHPDHSSGEEDSSHANVKARQRNLCCGQVAAWILLCHFHLRRIHPS